VVPEVAIGGVEFRMAGDLSALPFSCGHWNRRILHEVAAEGAGRRQTPTAPAKTPIEAHGDGVVGKAARRYATKASTFADRRSSPR
jgi:hypothetical protein